MILPLLPLLDDVRGPARGSGDHEQRREQIDRNAHQVIGDGRVPIEIGEHALRVVHGGLDALGDGIETRVASVDGQFARHLLHNVAARIADGVHGMPEADDDFAVGHAAADVGLGLVGRGVARLNLERDFVGAAVLRALERADCAGDARVEIGAGSGDDAGGEGGCVELVLRVQDQRRLHGGGPLRAGRGAVQQVKKVRGDGVDFESRGVSTSMRLPLRAKWYQ